MQLFDNLVFRVSDGMILCRMTEKVPVNVFLETMRRAMDAYRAGHKTAVPPAPSEPEKVDPVEKALECSI